MFLQHKMNLLSRIHIVWIALLIALIIKVGGYQGDVVRAMLNPAFWLWYAYTYFLTFTLLQLHYFIILSKNLPTWKAIIITTGVFFLAELITMLIFNYSDRSKRILYFTEIPFGTTLIILISIFLKSEKNKSKLVKHSSKITIDTINGISKISVENILLVNLSNTQLYIVLDKNKTIKVDKPLKYMINILSDYDFFYKLNRQCICSYKAITSFETEPDSRLKINFVDGNYSNVSKNRASDFKKWFDKHSPL